MEEGDQHFLSGVMDKVLGKKEAPQTSASK